MYMMTKRYNAYLIDLKYHIRFFSVYFQFLYLALELLIAMSEYFAIHIKQKRE
jgi:hypothetical protein